MSPIEPYNIALENIVELLDIPPSYYQKAAERYKSLGEWLHRKESKASLFSPDIYPQGSFRYGTVIRPLSPGDEYDLDLVCQVDLKKSGITQHRLKGLIGEEVQLYAKYNSFKEEAEEKPRCWRLNYADHVNFHMDILPCIPEDKEFIDSLVRLGVPANLASTAVAITDNRRANYGVISTNWPTSNPRGVATWFENSARAAAYSQIEKLVKCQIYASVDDVPPYEWKTPLQRSIQILKRHRDVMFKDSPEWKPLSMIITTLATHAYEGETDLGMALTNIIDRMPQYVNTAKPRIPNPVNPGEDFADRWAKDSHYEINFWSWHAQVKADNFRLSILRDVSQINQTLKNKFNLNLSPDMQQQLETSGISTSKVVVSAAPTIHIASAQKPWREYD